MGVDTRKPPLPAPTDVSWIDNGSVIAPTDLATDVSRRTDRTSYSIPEDGSPLTISTHKLLGETHVAGASQPSLLIEYFDDRGKSGTKSGARPKVRVRVTPHGTKRNDAVKITELGADKKPSYTRRISLGGRGESRIIDNVDLVQSGESNVSSRGPPIEVEVLNNSSDHSSQTGSRTRFVPPTSDISSMPPDSLLDEDHNKERSRSLERSRGGQSDSLKAPIRRRSRSLSRERIAQRVVEKLKDKEDLRDSSARRKLRKSRESTSKDISEESFETRSRRTSSLREDDLRSGTDSSLLRTKDQYSNISATTKSSIANPRLLQTVEDAIRRLILPEIETIKRQQSIHNDSRYVRRDRESFASDRTDSRDDGGRSLAKASSAPHINPKVVLTHDANDPGTILTGDTSRRHRRDSSSEKSRRDSQSTSSRDTERERKSKLRHDRDFREAAAASTAGLTAAALKSHNSQSSLEREKEKRERRKQRSKSGSRTESSTINTEDDLFNSKEPVPPMPMRSEMQDSDITRESILSAETAGSNEMPVLKDMRSPIRENTRSSPRMPIDHPRSVRSASAASSRSNRSARNAAGLGGAAGALYGLDRKKSSERRSLEPISPNRDNRESDHDTTPRPKVRDNTFAQRELLEPTERPETALPAARQEEIRRSLVMDEPSQGLQAPFPSVRQEQESRALGKHGQEAPKAEDENADTFYQDQSELNDRYRSDVSYDSQSPDEQRTVDPFTQRTIPSPSTQQQQQQQQQKQRQNSQSGLKPEVMDIPLGPESVVASIFGTSTVASTDMRSRSIHARTYSDATDERGEEESPTRSSVKHDVFEHDNASMERWAAIRNHARALSDESGKSGEADRSSERGIDFTIMSSTNVEHGGHDAVADHQTVDDRAISAKSSTSDGTQSSVVRKPVSNENWSRQSMSQSQMDRSFGPPTEYQHYLTMSGPAQQGHLQARHPSGYQAAMQPPEYAAKSPSQSRNLGQSSRQEFPMNRPSSQDKDEGYVSGPPAQSAGSITPLSFSKDPPRLFGSAGPDKYESIVADDPFTGSGNRHMRQLSEDSRAFSSPGQDAASGKGAGEIQSKDVVALMDHLTVRDGQRSARDTEILVTLVRSASELRNFQDEIKRFIAQQNKISMEKTDQTIKALGGPRPQPFSPRDRINSGEHDESSGKKPSFFKRALKGLSSKNPSDLEKIEDMFMQILDEMEELREHAGMNRLPSGQPQQYQQGLNSYEQLRAAPYRQESGLQPRNTSVQVTDNHQRDSGRFDNEFNARHSYASGERGVENSERMLTPTQERYTGAVRFAEDDEEITSSPKNTDKDRKHKSTGSSVFSGFPKMSRWSKTAAPSAPVENQHDERPYSQHSQSGSQVDILSNEDVYMHNQDDRLRSANSFNRSIPRTSSPLVAEHVKYHAHNTQPPLLHPQPRQGPTDRHHTQLESQADDYDDLASLPSSDSDAFGSVPNLARFPNGGIAGTRIHVPVQGTEYGGNMRSADQPTMQQQEPSHLFEQSRQAPQTTDSSKAHTLLGVHNPSAAPNHEKNSPHRPTASQSSVTSTNSSSTSSSATSAGQHEHPSAFAPQHVWIDPIPLSRKRSPYSPGGLLAPIEERYSMEQSEHGEWAQKHLPLILNQQQQQQQPGQGLQTRKSEDGERRPSYAETTSSITSGRSARSGLRNEILREEEDEDGAGDRSLTPRASPRPAVRNAGGSGNGYGNGGGQQTPESQSPTMRKITGPREMPRSSSGGVVGASGVIAPVQAIFQEEPRALMGTRTRKPAPGGRR